MSHAVANPFSVHAKPAVVSVTLDTVNTDGSGQDGGVAEIIVGEEKQNP